MTYIISVILGYLMGSIPFSYLVPKIAKGVDIRTIGSGNVGATNVYRLMGYPGAVMAFAGDILKGILAGIIAYHLFGYKALLVAGFSSLVGHCYSFILSFKGGKGVSISAGIVLLASFPVFAVMAVIQIGLMKSLKIVSLASIISSMALPIVAILLKQDKAFVVFSLAMSLFVIFQHRANIVRLLNGQEKRVTRTS